ncbi:hypothetical protein CF328_g2107 [Tilletia controversa]|nr:hypothetical protein CF328_g2107 [Tilletia controversa]
MRTKLPVEIQLMILALACDSHASFLKMNDVFLGNLMTPANRNAIGPVFFDPAWTRREVGARHALPQSGQKTKELERVRNIPYSLILPSHFIGVKAALQMWRQAQWTNSSSSAAVEVLGGQLLDLWNQGRWASANGTPIRRFFAEATELLGYLNNLRWLEKLDLRMGVWMMYKSWIEDGQYFDQEWLYGLVGRNVRLTKLSIALDIRRNSVSCLPWLPAWSVGVPLSDESCSEDDYQYAQVYSLANVREFEDDEFDPSPRTEKQSDVPQAPPSGPPPTPPRDLFDRCDSDIVLEHLREFHYEVRWLPYHVLQKFKMPIVELFVLRWRGEMPFYRAGDGPLPFLFRTVKHGSIGPFATKDLAIEAYRSTTGHVDLGLLVSGNVVLFNMQGEHFRDYHLYSKPQKRPNFSNAGRTSQPSDGGGPHRTSRGHNRSQKPYSGDGVNRNTSHQDRPSGSSRSYENSSPSQSEGPKRASDSGWGGGSGRHRDYAQGHAGGSSGVAGYQGSGSRDTHSNLGQSHAGGSSYWRGYQRSGERDTRGNPVPQRRRSQRS